MVSLEAVICGAVEMEVFLMFNILVDINRVDKILEILLCMMQESLFLATFPMQN